MLKITLLEVSLTLHLGVDFGSLAVIQCQPKKHPNL